MVWYGMVWYEMGSDGMDVCMYVCTYVCIYIYTHIDVTMIWYVYHTNMIWHGIMYIYIWCIYIYIQYYFINVTITMAKGWPKMILKTQDLRTPWFFMQKLKYASRIMRWILDYHHWKEGIWSLPLRRWFDHFPSEIMAFHICIRLPTRDVELCFPQMAIFRVPRRRVMSGWKSRFSQVNREDR